MEVTWNTLSDARRGRILLLVRIALRWALETESDGRRNTVTAVLLGAILLVIICGGIFLYRVLVAIRNLLEEINRKLPSSPLLTTLLSLGSD